MNSEARRQKIIDAAIQVLQQKGVAASRMNDFVEASGLSKGGVYHHFDSKEQLLVGVLDSFLHTTLARISLDADTKTSAHQQLKQLLQGQHDFFNELSQYNQLFVDFSAQAAFLPQFRQQMRTQYLMFHQLLCELLELGVAKGEFQKNTPIESIACGLRGIIDGIGMAMLIAPDVIDFPDSAIDSALTLLEGIRRH